MEILLWLAPAGLVTVVTMLWVAWWGRDGRGVQRPADRETAARLLGEALERSARHGGGYAAERRTTDRSTGVALRASRQRPTVVHRAEPEPEQRGTVRPEQDDSRDDSDRRAS